MPVIVERETLPSIDAALLKRWGAISTTITADLFAGRVLANPAIRPIRRLGQGGRLAARALTVHCDPPDFGSVLAAVDLLEAGDVLVIAANGDRDTAVIGDILGGHARRKGAAGVVCDGAVRDIAVLHDWMDFPVFSRFTTARGPSSKSDGIVNGPVSIGRVTIEPGSFVVGDDDGLVVLSPEDAAQQIGAAEQRACSELEWVARLQAGETLRSVFGVEVQTR